MYASWSSRSRTASQSSQTEIMTAAPQLRASRQQQKAGRESAREEFPSPQQYQRLGDSNEDSRTAPPAIRGPSAPSSTVPPEAKLGDVPTDTGRGSDGAQVSTKAPPSSLLRERAVRTWWRGLSCGVCFAAGAWAREGHAVYGAVLALVAVVGEAMLYYGA